MREQTVWWFDAQNTVWGKGGGVRPVHGNQQRNKRGIGVQRQAGRKDGAWHPVVCGEDDESRKRGWEGLVAVETLGKV